MEKPLTKFFLAMCILSFIVWMSGIVLKNIEVGKLVEFGTLQFRFLESSEAELNLYRIYTEYSGVVDVSYFSVLIFAGAFIRTTRRSMKENGWLLMSSILLFVFIPLEMYCGWLDWKLIGLTYWGDWPIEEFRKAFVHRLTAAAGLPFVAQLCYFTIPVLIFFRPLRKTTLK